MLSSPLTKRKLTIMMKKYTSVSLNWTGKIDGITISFTNRKYANSTTLSKIIKQMKDETGISPIIKWDIAKKKNPKLIKEVATYVVCVWKKNYASSNLLKTNCRKRRSELISACRHVDSCVICYLIPFIILLYLDCPKLYIHFFVLCE